MPPKGKRKAAKHIKKSVKNQKKAGGSSSLPHMGSTSRNRKSTDARPTKYSPEGDWIIMGDGSSRPNPKKRGKKKREEKPYKGW
jgi:hypothetical protein